MEGEEDERGRTSEGEGVYEAIDANSSVAQVLQQLEHQKEVAAKLARAEKEAEQAVREAEEVFLSLSLSFFLFSHTRALISFTHPCVQFILTHM